MTRKYEFTKVDRRHHGIRLRQIVRLSDGAIGGWIESESNLSHEGTCWIGPNAMAYGQARVVHDAQILDYARVFDCATIHQSALLRQNAWVYDHADISGYAQIYHYAKIGDYATVTDHARVYDSARIVSRAVICNNAQVCGTAYIYKWGTIHSNMIVADPVDGIEGAITVDDIEPFFSPKETKGETPLCTCKISTLVNRGCQCGGK